MCIAMYTSGPVTHKILIAGANGYLGSRLAERLLARGDALAARVPSRRVAAALRALHRDALALIDARARLAAADACLAFLRETVGEAAAGSESDASAEALFRRRRDMAGAFFEVLALGGLLPREPLEDAR